MNEYSNLVILIPIVVLVAVRDWHRVNITLFAALIACLVAYVTYLALPIAFPRPALGEGLADRVLAAEYAADFSPGANKLPSLHVTFAWLVALASRGQRLGRIGDVALFGLAAAISVSTLLVKQHILIDVAAGTLLAFTAYALAGRLYWRVVDPTREPRDVLRQLLRSPRAFVRGT